MLGLKRLSCQTFLEPHQSALRQSWTIVAIAVHVAILYEVYVGLQAFYLYNLAADLGMLALKVSKQSGSEQCTADYLQSLPAFPALNKSFCFFGACKCQ